MFQVRFHGRGGQGVVTAAELLASAAFPEDRYAQAFPSFGSERMGAFLNVESEFAATSVAIGASAAGACARLTPGWIQLYAETNQEAADLHIQALQDRRGTVQPGDGLHGRLPAHPRQRARGPSETRTGGRLPPAVRATQVLDPDDPVSIGAMVGPEAFTEVRYLAFERMRRALEVISAVEADFGAQFGRGSGGLVKLYRTDDADLIVVALGSVLGTVKDAIDELRDDGVRVGALGITTFRPFPAQAVRDALGDDNRLRRLVVLERSLAPGAGGVVTADLRTALATGDGGPRDAVISTVIAGLGGRPVTRRSLRRMLTRAARGELPEFSFLDLDTHLVEGELTRIRAARRSGPSAENILRALARRS